MGFMGSLSTEISLFVVQSVGPSQICCGGIRFLLIDLILDLFRN